MRTMAANTLSRFARKSAESVSDFASVVRNLILDVRDSYHPEVHYMRGPGPKWRAKHQPWLRFDSEAVPPGRQHGCGQSTRSIGFLRHPAERLAAWRCVIGKQDGRGI